MIEEKKSSEKKKEEEAEKKEKSEKEKDPTQYPSQYPFIQSFGRKRSHGLSDAQKLDIHRLYEIYGLKLPECMVNPGDLFGSSSVCFRQVYVEIGFGAGEHLVQNSIKNPEVGFVGCEPFENGVVRALRGVHDNNLENVRIFNGDARFLLEKFANKSVDRFYILFPDPWPKQKYHKRRLISENFVRDFLHPKLKQEGEIVVATDCEDYMRSIVKIFTTRFSDCFTSVTTTPMGDLSSDNLKALQKRPEWFISTRYEQNALSKGLKPFYLVLRKSNYN